MILICTYHVLPSILRGCGRLPDGFSRYLIRPSTKVCNTLSRKILVNSSPFIMKLEHSKQWKDVILMSDYFIRFIPENISRTLCREEIDRIKEINWDGNIPKFISNDNIRFADAGQNFESVVCPSCKENLMEWWGSAMNFAYSYDYGFANLEVVTPCCTTRTTLHSLEYNFPQGFYRTMIEIMPILHSKAMPDEIANSLFAITGESWRIIHALY